MKQVVKEFKRKVAPQSCHPSRRLMDSSDVDLHLVRAYWAHMSQPPYGISIGSAVFAYTAAKTPPMLCNRPDIPQNYPFPLRYLDPHLIHGSVGPPDSTPQTASRSVKRFCRVHEHEKQTDTQTDRPCYSAITAIRCRNRPAFG